jgi:hypothetical protein
MTYVIVLIVVLVFAVALALALRGREGSDGVDSFRRQIDALSPEARKPTVDQVKSAEREIGEPRTEHRDASGDGADDSNGEDS